MLMQPNAANQCCPSSYRINYYCKTAAIMGMPPQEVTNQPANTFPNRALSD